MCAVSCRLAREADRLETKLVGLQGLRQGRVPAGLITAKTYSIKRGESVTAGHAPMAFATVLVRFLGVKVPALKARLIEPAARLEQGHKPATIYR